MKASLILKKYEELQGREAVYLLSKEDYDHKWLKYHVIEEQSKALLRASQALFESQWNKLLLEETSAKKCNAMQKMYSFHTKKIKLLNTKIKSAKNLKKYLIEKNS